MKMLRHRSIYLVPCLALALLVTALTPFETEAAISGCRLDPTVVLSNGATVIMQVAVTDTLSDVKGVTYTLHAPSGTKVTSVTYDQYQALEHFQFVADQSSGRYVTTSLVSTGTRAAVVAGASVTQKTCDQAPAAVVGTSGAPLTSTFHCQ